MFSLIGSPGSGDYGMEMDDMGGMQGHMDDMDGMDHMDGMEGYGDESAGMVRYENFNLRSN